MSPQSAMPYHYNLLIQTTGSSPLSIQDVSTQEVSGLRLCISPRPLVIRGTHSTFPHLLLCLPHLSLPPPTLTCTLVTSAIFAGYWGRELAPPPSASSTLSLPCYSSLPQHSSHTWLLQGRNTGLFIAGFPAECPAVSRYSALVE